MLWLVILLPVLAAVYWYGVSRYSILANEPSRGPNPWPYIGNLLDVNKHGGMHKMLMHYFKAYGRVHKMFIGRAPAIVVSDPEIVKQIVIKEFHKFPNRPLFIKPNPPMDSGMFLGQGALWKRIRTTLTPTFSTAKLKQIVPIIDSRKWPLSPQQVERSESTDCVNLFSLFALDVITISAFGVETDIQTDPDSSFYKLAKKAFRTPIWVRAFSMFPFSEYLSKYVHVLPNIDYFLKIALSMVEQRKKHGSQGRKKDLVTLMLEAREDTVDGVPRLNDQELAAQSLTFLLAGFETTTNTLANTAYLLARHPDVQDKLIQELDLAGSNRGNSPLYEYSQKIDYLDRVINESLRLYPPGYLIIRRYDEECTIQGVHFPRGVDVNIPVYILHRDPAVWERPDDFDPEHFSHEANEKRHPYSFIPFGMGPRQCIGMRFALMEIKIALVNILEKYKFCSSEETQDLLEHRAVILMAPRDPIKLKVARR
ncbi:predicted protein [Nematostella vectensis]|uniref:Cytochrome P450 n=1 Tax=Nematostella vectensis TaxID=45351 RepID=A7SXR0_NEMVE|nr:predicted protein [Nematostella vectensis]|eukprot:XP_001623608.1 predicted protein [Nematostella vectensis]